MRKASLAEGGESEFEENQSTDTGVNGKEIKEVVKTEIYITGLS